MSEGSRTAGIMRELGMSLGQPMVAVVGCGGAGNNIVDSIYWQCHGVHTVVVNTDTKSLDKTSAHKKILLGGQDGGYALPEMCESLAEQESTAIRKAVSGYDFVFVVAGLGGAAGSGIAPVVARIAREEGAVVFSVPVLPFTVEGNRRDVAMMAMEQLSEVSHCIIPLDNDKLQGICGAMGFDAAFDIINKSVLKIIDKVYEHSSSFVSDLIDDVSSGFSSIEDVVTAEHEIALDEMPATAVQAPLGPGLEFPFETHWNDMMFG